VQFEGSNAQIVERRELNFGASRKLVRMRRQLGVNDVVVNSQPLLLGSSERRQCNNAQQ
jgi:hypothetical protein